MKILILGGRGQLGKCLNDQFKNTHHKIILTCRDQIDITNFQQSKNIILDISPDVVINATAYTDVDNAEKNTKISDLINNYSVANIATTCKKANAFLFHISTDYVFDGKSNIPYKENDETNPLCIYGKTKLAGEIAIKSSGCKHIIIRTSWVYSEYEKNFLKTMLLLGKDQDELSIIGDQIGCPTYAQDIAKAIVKILSQIKLDKIYGLYNFCGDQILSWYDFSKIIFNCAKKNNFKTPNIVNKIETSAFPKSAKRPTFSALDCTRINNSFGVINSNCIDGINQAIRMLKV